MTRSPTQTVNGDEGESPDMGDAEEDDPDLAEAIRLSQLDTMNIEDERRREKEELEEV